MNDFQKYIKETNEYGIVEKIAMPTVQVAGLPGAKIEEEVIFETGEKGYVSELNRDSINVILLSKTPVTNSIKVARTNQTISFPVGPQMLGQVVDPLGKSLFTSANYKKPGTRRYIDTKPMPISKRVRINRQLKTSLGIIDTLIPIGMGQRELFLGDRKTGKTSALIPLVKSQAKDNNIIIYACVGKRSTEIKRIKTLLEKEGSLSNTVIVATSSSDAASLIDITPYAAMTLAEYFVENNRNVLIIFDDLTTHAATYREIALASKRFPGRESYPGDIFYKHAKLLERAGNFKINNNEYSLTALPVAETVDSDLSSYIISNLIGITDGHILFDQSLFNKGFRPSVDIFLSVTRVGKQTQPEMLREVNRELTKFLKDYQKAQEVSHFGAEVSTQSQNILDIGSKMYKFFNYNQKYPVDYKTELTYILLIWQNFCKDINFKNGTEIKSKVFEASQKKDIKSIVNKVFKQKTLKEARKVVEKNSLTLLKTCSS
jgi:F-type H+-transporting ATPase subunit alpha